MRKAKSELHNHEQNGVGFPNDWRGNAPLGLLYQTRVVILLARTWPERLTERPTKTAGGSPAIWQSRQ